MFVRSLIVFLAVLNLGVALWWLTRPSEPTPDVVDRPVPAGVARLQLVEPDVAKPTRPAAVEPAPAPPIEPVAEPVAPAPAPRPTATPVSAAAEVRCLSLGPFAAQDEARTVLVRAGSRLQRARIREESAADVAAYRVMMRSVGDRAAAQAIVKRIGEAGLSDYYVIAESDGYSIALGKYRNREGAERRQSELRAKGFPAELLADARRSHWWVDARSQVPAAAIAAAVHAPGQHSLDCATLR